VRLQRLQITRLPGIDQPFVLDRLGPGLHAILGPNGSGKSSLCRAVRGLLWAAQGPRHGIEVEGVFEEGERRWLARRQGPDLQWQQDGAPSAPPQLPASHLAGCFFLELKALLDDSREAELDLAGEIRRQLAGGYDLETVEADLFPSRPRRGRREGRELQEASRGLSRELARQQGLAGREAELGALEEELQGVEAEEARRPWLQAALRLHELRGELGEAEALQGSLPPVLGSLRGDEEERLDGLEARLEELRGRRELLGEQRDQAIRSLEQTKLPGSVDATELEASRTRANDLARQELALEGARRGCQGERERLAATRRALGARDESVLELDPGAPDELFGLLRRAQELDARQRVLDERLAQLPSAEEVPEGELEKLEAGSRALRGWLSSRAPTTRFVVGLAALLLALGTGLASWLHAGLAALAGLGLGAAAGVVLQLVARSLSLGTGFAAWLQVGFAALVGLGLGAFAAALLLSLRRSAALTRGQWEAQFARLDLAPPQGWKIEAVEGRLAEFDETLAALRERRLSADARAVQVRELEAQAATLVLDQHSLDEQRQELRARLGLEADLPDPELIDLALRVYACREARASFEQVEAQRRSLDERCAALRAALGTFLQAHGEAAAADSAQALACVTRVADRSKALTAAIEARGHLEGELERLEEDAERLREERTDVYDLAGLGDSDRRALQRLLEQLPRYRELEEQLRELRTRIDYQTQQLEQAGQERLIELTEEELRRDQQALELGAARLEELRETIPDLRGELRRTREGHDLEQALAARDAARERLEQCLEAALYTRAGRWLLDVVREEHDRSQVPELLQRTRALFAAFTHHSYRLDVPRRLAEASLRVRDTRSGRDHGLAELSDGTRGQLLLAARLAFAEDVEREVRLPLFLDESLAHSDPARFAAVARSLGRIAEDQARQIFYLTSDVEDVKRLESALDEEGVAPPRVHDLAEIRRLAVAATVRELTVTPLPEVPRPQGMGPEQYGELLGVPALDPRRGADAQHLLFLLWDELDSLHRLLEAQVRTVGQWRELSRQGLGADCAGDEDQARRLDARAALFEAFCEAWCEGRGRSVDREAIQESGAVSDRFMEPVLEIIQSCAGDARALLEVLRGRGSESLRGFRGAKIEELETFLANGGWLDTRRLLDRDQIATRLLLAASWHVLPQGESRELLHRWWEQSAAAA
jgi:exonuclease SbcC